jgi:hypothetical protein
VPRRLIPGNTPAAACRILPRNDVAEDDEQNCKGLATIEVPPPPAMMFHVHYYIENKTSRL